jgi:tetratricopeptide (TPR) repeat protein/predicted Ser/Thr protein kinase
MTCNVCGYTPIKADGTCPNCTTNVYSTVQSPYERFPLNSSSVEFAPQAIIANRYRILQHIGRGGMGSVYKAEDLELNRVIALKTIRGDLAEHSWALQRMKKEVVLASEVTHKNVSRVFDLGQHGDVRFLTMEFIEGKSLGERLRAGERFTHAQAANIMLQCAEGLRAAHEAGVVHRDLKPDNIMLRSDGKVSLMDFGLARLKDELAASSFSGTPRYVSPEQVHALTQDQRSDIYSLGLVFYELISGEHPFPDPSSQGIRRRVETEAPRLAARDPRVPQKLSNIVARCMAIHAEDRCTAAELVAELSTYLHPYPFYQRRSVIAGFALVLLLLAAATFWLANRTPVKPPDRVTVLVADFENTTNEAVFNSTLEPMLQVALEGAPFITAYDRGAAKRLAAQLRPKAAALDTEGARLVAIREGIGAVISGSIARNEPGHYTIKLRTVSSDGKDLMKEQQASMVSDEVLVSLSKLTVAVRQALGDQTPKTEQIRDAETFTASSLDAAHQYAVAQELQYRGQYDEAAKAYEETIRLDPNMGRAYAGLAVVNRNLNHPVEAIKNFELALARMDRMSDREKLRTRGAYYITANDYEKAAEEMKTLVERYPADTAGHANLALALLLLRQTRAALQEGRKAVEIYPKNLTQRNNVALYAMYAGDFATAEHEATEVLKENPKFEKPYIAVALSALFQTRPDTAVEFYEKLQGVSARGSSMSAVGLADLASYQGRLDDAIELLQRGIAVDEERKNPESAARKYADLAQIQMKLNHKPEAAAAANRATAATTDIGTVLEAAFVSIDVRTSQKAADAAAKLRSKVGTENQVAADLIEGYSQLNSSPVQALDTFRKAQQTLDTWLGHFLLGRAYVNAKAYAEAHSEFEECIKRSGEASAVFLDDVPTSRFLPPVFYYLAKSEEGLNVASAEQSYQKFLSVQTATHDQDPLVAAARLSLAKK